MNFFKNQNMMRLDINLYCFNLQCIQRSCAGRLLLKVARLQVSRHRWQLNYQSIQLLGHLDLASQATRLRQSES